MGNNQLIIHTMWLTINGLNYYLSCYCHLLYVIHITKVNFIIHFNILIIFNDLEEDQNPFNSTMIAQHVDVARITRAGWPTPPALWPGSRRVCQEGPCEWPSGRVCTPGRRRRKRLWTAGRGDWSALASPSKRIWSDKVNIKMCKVWNEVVFKIKTVVMRRRERRRGTNTVTMTWCKTLQVFRCFVKECSV